MKTTPGHPRIDVTLSPDDFALFEELCMEMDIKKAGLARMLMRFALQRADEAFASQARAVLTRRLEAGRQTNGLDS